MFDLLQVAHAKLTQEIFLANPDLRIIVGHTCLINVLRQSLSYVEGDFIECRSQTIGARAAALNQEYSLLTAVSAGDDSGMYDENQQWLQMDNMAASNRKPEKRIERGGEMVVKAGNGSADDKLIEYMQQAWLLPPSVDGTDERSKKVKNQQWLLSQRALPPKETIAVCSEHEPVLKEDTGALQKSVSVCYGRLAVAEEIFGVAPGPATIHCGHLAQA